MYKTIKLILLFRNSKMLDVPHMIHTQTRNMTAHVGHSPAAHCTPET